MRIDHVSPTMPGRPRRIILSRADREILLTPILRRLNSIDALRIAVRHDNWKEAAELGQEFSDLLLLVCVDLGWGPTEKSEFELKTPPTALAGAVAAIARKVQTDHHVGIQDGEEARDVDRLVGLCERIRSALGGKEEEHAMLSQVGVTEVENLRVEVSILIHIMWEESAFFTRADLVRELGGHRYTQQAIEDGIDKLVRVGLLHEQGVCLLPTRQTSYMATLVEVGGW